MLVERAELMVREGAEAEFAQVMAAKALPLLRATAGAVSVEFGRGVENPSKFTLLIEWSGMPAHTAFTQHASFADFRAVMAPYTVGGAMEHFEMV